MSEIKPGITVEYSEILSDDLVTGLREDTATSASPVTLVERKRVYMAALEWIVPAAVTVFAVPFLTSFATEAGKDFYSGLKKAIEATAKRMMANQKVRPIRIITGTESPNKAPTQEFTPAFAVQARISEKTIAKFLFPWEMEPEEIESYTDRILDFIQNEADSDVVKLVLKNGELALAGRLFLTFDKKTKELTILNPSERISERIAKQRASELGRSGI